MSIPTLIRQAGRPHVIIKNTVWLGLASGVAGLGDFLLTIYVIRKFGAAQYGVFGYAFSFVSLFGTLFDFGLAMAVTREFATDRTRERYFANLAVLKGAISLLGLGVVWIGGWLVTSDPLTRRLMVLLSLYVAFTEFVNFFYALFRSRQRMELEATFRFLYVGCLAVFVIGLTVVHPTVFNVAVAYLVAAALTASGVVMYVWRKAGLPPPMESRIDLSTWRTYLAIGVYIALLRGAGDVNQYIGAVTLGHLGRLAQIGWYNAADKIYGVMLFPMALITSAIFPALAEARSIAPGRFVEYWKEWARVTLVLSMMFGVLIAVKAPEIIELLYGTTFFPAVLTLRILVIAALLVYLQSLYYHALLIADRQRELFLAGFAATVVHVILNFVLVPPLGLYGVALGTVLSQAVMLGQCLVLTSRYAAVRPVYPELAHALVVSAVSGAAMWTVLVGLPHGRVWFAIGVGLGLLVYVLLIVLCTEGWRQAVSEWLVRRFQPPEP